MTPFLDTLAGHYKACPYGPAFSRTVSKAAEGLDAEAQVAAAERLVRSRKAKGWPSLSECEEALRDAASAPAPVSNRTWKSGHEYRSEAIADREKRINAYRLCRCRMGREAHAGGWLNALVDFATDHGRLPSEREIADLIALAKRNDEAAAHSPFEGLRTIRKAMHDRAYREVWGMIDGHPAKADAA